MKAAFTPGPWKFREIAPDDPEWGACEITDEADTLVATHVCGIANARLIASAPALFEALKLLLLTSEWADETGYVEDAGFVNIDTIREQARAALAQAGGEV